MAITIQGVRHVHTQGDIDEYVLESNGMRMLLVRTRHEANVLTHNVTYLVGSRNESYGVTGYTHALEHALFKGSLNFNKAKKTSIWSVLGTTGARINATTSKARTHFFATLPSQHLRLAMRIEADRMRMATFTDDDLSTEMTTIRNEFERGETSAISVLCKTMWATAYSAHPVRTPTIGYRSDIEAMTAAKLRAFYDKFYYPNNATLVVVGNFEPADVLRCAVSTFGRVHASPCDIDRIVTVEPPQCGLRTFVVARHLGAQSIVAVAYKSPPATVATSHSQQQQHTRTINADVYALLVLACIMGDGKSGRLYRQLVDTGMASAVDTGASMLPDAGLFETYVFLTIGTKTADVTKRVRLAYEQVKSEGVTASEVLLATTKLCVRKELERDSTSDTMFSINEAVAAGDWRLHADFKESVLRVRPDDVLRVARTYLVDDECTIGIYMPKRTNAVVKHTPVSPPDNNSTPADKGGGGGGGGGGSNDAAKQKSSITPSMPSTDKAANATIGAHIPSPLVTNHNFDVSPIHAVHTTDCHYGNNTEPLRPDALLAQHTAALAMHSERKTEDYTLGGDQYEGADGSIIDGNSGSEGDLVNVTSACSNVTCDDKRTASFAMKKSIEQHIHDRTLGDKKLRLITLVRACGTGIVSIRGSLPAGELCAPLHSSHASASTKARATRTSTDSAAPSPLNAGEQEGEGEGETMKAMHTDAAKVVPDAHNRMVPLLTAALLDEGTRKRSKYDIAKRLDAIGASLSFGIDKYRVSFSAKMLARDTDTIIELVAEQLREPLLDATDLQKAKVRMRTALEHCRDDTGEMARRKLERTLYPMGHANRALRIEQELAMLDAVTIDDVRAYHAAMYGTGEHFFVTVVGDLVQRDVERSLEKHFCMWKPAAKCVPLAMHRAQMTATEGGRDASAMRRHTKLTQYRVPLEGKASSTMLVGQTVGIDASHDDYVALSTGVYALGGIFSSRLMQVVRDRMGLTYGIRSSMRCGNDNNDAYFCIQATFAPSNVKRGRQETLKVTYAWQCGGVRAQELEAMKSAIVGAYQVGMETTSGTSALLLDCVEQKRPLSWIDEFPRRVQALDRNTVNRAIRKYIEPRTMVVVEAGTFNVSV